MKWFIYSGCLLIIIFVAYIYFSFNGTPWDKVTFEKQAIQYVDQKYNVDFSLKSVSYDFKNAEFSAIFYLDDSKPEIFSVYPTNKGLRDNFFVRKWEVEFKTKLQPLIDLSFNTDTKSIFKIERNDITENQKTIETMPSYNEVREEIYPYTNLLILINRKFNENQDMSQLQQFLNDMNNSKLNVKLLTILYQEPKSDFETREVFEIISEFGDTYQLDRILEYKVR